MKEKKSKIITRRHPSGALFQAAVWKGAFRDAQVLPGGSEGACYGSEACRVRKLSPTTTLLLFDISRDPSVETSQPRQRKPCLTPWLRRSSGRKTAPWDPHAGPSAALCVQHPLETVAAALLWDLPLLWLRQGGWHCIRGMVSREGLLLPSQLNPLLPQSSQLLMHSAGDQTRCPAVIFFKILRF